MNAPKAPRMSAADRRESILNAATAVFGERGYTGGTTDVIANAAGISQAYVVRMFGSKELLFVEAGRRAADKVAAEFRAVIAEFTGDESAEQKERLMGGAYSVLMADRGTLLTLMHFCSLGHDPTFGPMARSAYMDIYRLVRDEAAMGPDHAMRFMAHGMLVNTVMGLRLPDIAGEDPDARELLTCAFDAKGDEVLGLAGLSPRVNEA